MRTFKPKKTDQMTAAERKKWRAKWLERLSAAGHPFFDLAGKSDHEIWQLKNKYFPSGFNGGATMKQQDALRRPKHGVL